MLKPIEKIVFTSTGEVRPPSINEFYLLSDGSVFKCTCDDYGVAQHIYTKSIELVQPELIEDKEYFHITVKNLKFYVSTLRFRNEREINLDIYRDKLKCGNIFNNERDAQIVVDQINLLIQEKGYFTPYPDNPES